VSGWDSGVHIIWDSVPFYLSLKIIVLFLKRRLKGSVTRTALCSGRKPVLSSAAEKELGLAGIVKRRLPEGFP